MKIDKILSDLTKIEYLYTILDILNKNAEEYLKSNLIKYFYLIIFFIFHYNKNEIF